MNILLYLIYGDRRAYHLELSYSILSAARFLTGPAERTKIVLVCDAANRRPDLPVEHLEISAGLLHKWQLNGAYHHAAKINALHHALDKYQAPVALVDSDTVWQQHPDLVFDRIAPGHAIMHASEGTLEDSLQWPEWHSLIHQCGGQVAGLPVGPKTEMLNSGVLGLHPDDAQLLDLVVETIMDMRGHSAVFTAEQLAASIVLMEKADVDTCTEVVSHYWDGPRDYYHYQMKRFFPQVMSGGGVEDPDAPLPPLRDTPPSRLSDRIVTRIKRQFRGNDPEYGFALLAYRSALSYIDSDPDLANIWSRTAVEMLIFAVSRPHPKVREDFALFAPAQLERQAWLWPKIKDRWDMFWAANPG